MTRPYVMVIESSFPLNTQGSSDAGNSVHASVSELNLLMEKAAKMLNLKPHIVGFTKDNQVMLHAAGDLEVKTIQDILSP